ncbi:hypothetical protein REPUB_Repub13aG0082800 [Reevesia pubescens]
MDAKVENGCIQEDKRWGWGKSLPVQSVQEIVRNDSQSVPKRYIQEHKDMPLVSGQFFHASFQIPIIYFSLLAKEDERERRKLDFSCKEWGFFSEEVLHKIKAAMAAFFELTIEEKKKDGVQRLQGELEQGLRINYYPPCSRPDLVLGISPHSDACSLTLLLQDDEITGLQIKQKEEWIPVKPIPNCLVVNIGDAIEIMSNGMYKKH